jgi:hypothetical protein
MTGKLMPDGTMFDTAREGADIFMPLSASVG